MKPQSTSPAQDLQIAREAYFRGDFAHAAEHASSALAANPEWAEALELLDSIIDTAPDKESLLKPGGQNTYFAHAAGRARVLYRIGRVGESVETLLNVLKVAPERGYEKWAVGWLSSSGVTIRPATAYGFLSSAIQDTLTRARLRPSEREYLARFVPLVFALLATPGCADDEVIRIGASGIFRRVGRIDSALQVLGFAAPPRIEVLRLTMLGLALRAMGDYVGAESAFRAAYQSNHDPAQLIEVARVRWDAGDLKGALDVLDSIYPHLVDPDEEVKLMLEYLKGKVTGDQPKSPLLSSLGEDATPDDLVLVQMFEVGSLEAPPEATINVIQQAIAKHVTLTPEDFRLRVSTLEAPSVRLAASLVLTGSPDPGVVIYEFESVPQPDPRMSVRRVGYLTWRYDGGVPRQGCPPPQVELRSAVEALAREPYFLPRWWARAAEVAESLGPGSAAGLVAAMVYPSAPLPPLTAWDWVRRVQFASALTLAQLDREWRTGPGRQALLDVIDGPMDWVVDAAVVALVERALDDPQATSEVASALEKLRMRIPDKGSWSIRGSLPFAYIRLPGRPAGERETFKELARNYFAAHRAR
jgi:tetratricopeptide (TPR) repeat protein